MPIKLKNKGRGPVTIELTSLGKVPQTDLRIGREGPREIRQAFPRSVTIPGRGVSEELPDAAKNDPALAALKGVIEVVEVPAAKPKES